MSFNGLEAKFNIIATALYTKFSTRNSVAGGINNDQPFLEFKPNDPNAEQTLNDSQFAPLGSTVRDISRMSAFMRSPEGGTFLITEEALQLLNPFSETRVLNPTFVVANAVPFVHAQRPVVTAVDASLSGDTSQQSPASNDSNIGASGRLQVETSNTAIGNAMGTGNISNLINILPFSGIINALSGLAGISTTGILGINDRPEFHVNDTLISIAQWEGFTKQNNLVSGLSSLVGNIQSGNIFGAISNVGTIISDVVNPQVSIAQQLGVSSATNSLPDGRGTSNNDNVLSGRRYFITDMNDGVDRYLVDSVVSEAMGVNGIPTTFLNDSLAYLHRTNYPSYIMPSGPSVSVPNVFAISPFSPPPTISDPFNTGLSSTSIFNAITNNQVINNIVTGISQTATAISNAARGIAIANTLVVPIGNDLNTLLGNAKNTLLQPSTIDNPAEHAMLFSALSLRQRYLDAFDFRVAFIRKQLDAQETFEFAYYAGIKPSANNGFVYSATVPQAGQENTNTPQTITRTGNYTAGGYITDVYNTIGAPIQGIFNEPSDGTEVSNATLDALSAVPDLINVFVYDFVNKNTVPFRAFITNINESVTPQVESTRYIGRVEKNVVYVGVDRKLSFALRIQAYSRAEMRGIWNKINYLTGLCYPSMYSDGFMVPSLIKLTIGDFYRDQPGYLESVVYSIDDQSSWEISANNQVPQGINVQVSFVVLDKQQMSAQNIITAMQTNVGDGMFYPAGTTRAATSTNTTPLLNGITNAVAPILGASVPDIPAQPISVPYAIPLNPLG